MNIYVGAIVAVSIFISGQIGWLIWKMATMSECLRSLSVAILELKSGWYRETRVLHERIDSLEVRVRTVEGTCHTCKGSKLVGVQHANEG